MYGNCKDAVYLYLKIIDYYKIQHWNFMNGELFKQICFNKLIMKTHNNKIKNGSDR